jgi:hypothetical protein
MSPTYEIRKYKNGLRFIKSNIGIGKYILEDLVDISNDYSFIYKHSMPFKEIKVDRHHSGFIFCKIDFSDISLMLKEINCFRFIASIDDCISLYDIKHKIQII